MVNPVGRFAPIEPITYTPQYPSQFPEDYGGMPGIAGTGSFSPLPPRPQPSGAAIYPGPLASDYGPGSPFQPGPYLPIGAPSPYSQSPAAQAGQQYRPQDLRVLGTLGPIAQGFGAGSQVMPTPSAGEAAFQVAGAGISGAAGGAATGATIGAMAGSAGGPPGALIGAGVGALTGVVVGGIQAYLGLRQARRQRREQERIYKEIQDREDKRAAEARADALEQRGYDRRMTAIQSRWNTMQFALSRMNEIMARDENMRNQFLQLGR